MSKIKIKEIEIKQATGNTLDIKNNNFISSDINEINSKIRSWKLSFDESIEEKIDYNIIFNDNFVYSGTYKVSKSDEYIDILSNAFYIINTLSKINDMEENMIKKFVLSKKEDIINFLNTYYINEYFDSLLEKIKEEKEISSLNKL